MGKRKSVNKSPGQVSNKAGAVTSPLNKSPNSNKVIKSDIFKTPKQGKLPAVVQSEQKQELKLSNKKRKSLPANLNGDGPESPKKVKIEPFTGTSDLFMQMNEEKPKSSIENTPKTNKKGSDKIKNTLITPKQQNQGNKKETGIESTSSGIISNRKQRQKDKLKQLRRLAKERSVQIQLDVASGNDTAIAHMKQRIAEIQQKPTLTQSAKRKLKRFKKILKECGIEEGISSEIPTSTQKNTNKVKKPDAKQTVQQIKTDKKSKNDKQGLKNKKLQTQISKSDIKKQVNVEAKESSDEEDAEEEEENEVSETEEDEASETEENDVSETEVADESIEAEENESDGSATEDDSDSDEVDITTNKNKTGKNTNKKTLLSNEGSDNDVEDNSDDEIEINHKKNISKKQPNAPIKQKESASDFTTKGQSRYVVFVGNLPFDITREEISEHFVKVGQVKDVRIPLDKHTNKCRGFAYVEVSDQSGYEKALSLHHTFVKGRRINVLYTQGGKKKGDEKKQEIKTKNFKLNAMRQGGKLAGNVKQSQKRSFRRGKQRNSNKDE